MALKVLLLIASICIARVYLQCMPIEVCLEKGTSAAIQQAHETCGSTSLTDYFEIIKKPLETLHSKIEEGQEACRHVVSNEIDHYVAAVYKECFKPQEQFNQSFIDDINTSYNELMKYSITDLEYYCPPLEMYLNTYYSLIWYKMYILEQCKIEDIIQKLYKDTWEKCME